MNVYEIKDTTYEEIRDNLLNKLPEEQLNFLKIMRYWYKYPKKSGTYTMFGDYHGYKSKNNNTGEKLLKEVTELDWRLHFSRLKIGKQLGHIIGEAWVTESYYFIEFPNEYIGEALTTYLLEEYKKVVKHIKYPLKPRGEDPFRRELKRPFVEIKE